MITKKQIEEWYTHEFEGARYSLDAEHAEFLDDARALMLLGLAERNKQADTSTNQNVSPTLARENSQLREALEKAERDVRERSQGSHGAIDLYLLAIADNLASAISTLPNTEVKG